MSDQPDLQKTAEDAPEVEQQDEKKNDKGAKKFKKDSETPSKPKADKAGNAVPKAQAKSKEKAVAKAARKSAPKATPKSAPSAGWGPKSAPKSAPKASPKGSAKAILKKPACGMKRPASAMVPDKAEEEEAAMEESPESEEEKVEDEFVVPGPDDHDPSPESQKKDRSKNQKFQSLLKSGTLPSWLQAEWQKTLTMGAGRTLQQRRLVNLSIDRNKVGLVLNVDKPEFQTIKNTYKTSESKDKVKSLSKTLFMGKFGLTQEALEEGLREGDFQQVVDKNGKIKYSWENMEHVTTRGKGSSSQQVENRSGTDKDAKLFAKQSKGMHLGLFGASGTQSSGVG